MVNTQVLVGLYQLLRPPLKDIWVPYLQFCTSSEMDLIWSIPNVDEICRRIRAGGSATSMALGREYGISCGSSTATVRRTGWTRQLDGAALCAVSSSLQHLASHVSAWPQRSNLKQGPMWDSVDKSNASELPYPQSRTARQWSWLQCDSVRDRVLRAFPTLHVHPIQNTSISAWDVIYYSSSPPLDYT